MGHMPAIPASTRSSITLRLLDHAEKHWPQLHKVEVTCRSSFAYVTGVLPGGEQFPLFRLRYGGSAHSFGFAIYSAGRYEDAVLLTGLPTGTPQEALDTACTVHLAGIGHEPDPEPPTNLRGHPLSHAQPLRPTGMPPMIVLRASRLTRHVNRCSPAPRMIALGSSIEIDNWRPAPNGRTCIGTAWPNEPSNTAQNGAAVWDRTSAPAACRSPASQGKQLVVRMQIGIRRIFSEFRQVRRRQESIASDGRAGR
jgi:hypothetical protein